MEALAQSRWLRGAVAVAWMVVIFLLSAQSTLPHLTPSLSDSLQDILGHFTAYAILATAVYWALEGSGATRVPLWTLVFVLLYACSDEFHQSFVPGRHPDLFDIATDLMGASFALLLLTLRRSRRLRSVRR